MEKLTLTVIEVGERLGISKPLTYALCDQPGFPCFRIGKRKIIPLDAFKEWLETQANSKSEIMN